MNDSSQLRIPIWRRSLKDKAIGKVALDSRALQSGALRQPDQLVRFEATQDRQGAVFPDQTIVQKQMAHRCVEIVSNCVAMQIDDEDAPARDAAQLTQ